MQLVCVGAPAAVAVFGTTAPEQVTCESGILECCTVVFSEVVLLCSA